MRGRPGTRVIRDPSAGPVGLQNPAAVLIRSPGWALLVRLPHVAVTGSIDPPAVRIQILSAGVIGIRLMNGVGAPDPMIAGLVEVVPVVSRGSVLNFVFGIVGAPDGDELALLALRAALWRRDLGFTVAHDHVTLGVT